MKDMMDFFPFEKVRNVQKECMELVENAINAKTHLVLHAPTGLGKTAATLVPAIRYAVANNKTVFFLTSRNTQHFLAMDTIKKIKEKSKEKFIATDIIGKQSMCLVPHIEKLYSSEFSEFCRKMREDYKCNYYANTRKKTGALTVEARVLLEELKENNPVQLDIFLESCKKSSLCPYEIAAILAQESSVIVADHYHLFHPHIRKAFLAKIKKELEDSIIIVDEAHNLPQRIRDTLTSRVSTNAARFAFAEAKKNYEEIALKILRIENILRGLARGMKPGQEKLVLKNSLISAIEQEQSYKELLEELSKAGEEIREEHHISYVARIADFLAAWQADEEGFARILQMSSWLGKPNVVLSYRCLDPNIASGEVVKDSHSTILMSGTLTPTFMYKDLLGFPKQTREAEFPSPFPKENKLCLIVPRTTTRFSRRTERQYAEIAQACTELVEAIPGNVALFFPSYQLRDSIACLLDLKKPSFVEKSNALKAERKELLEKFKQHKSKGAVLLAVSSGSFGEGIDLPGDLLQGVIVVGMPFKTPDLETQELIKYYNKKYGKGWDYGYVLPAVTRILQNAGRCIRSETDRGVIIFLDERYSFYGRCFPLEWKAEICKNPLARIQAFFEMGSL
jgi:DNA excision repair protein ERCC-2